MNDNQVQPQEALQSIKLIEGLFTPSEASDILNVILDKKINFHKIQRLKITEGNQDDPCSLDNSRLEELISAKERLAEIIQIVRADGKKMRIQSNIHFEVVD